MCSIATSILWMQHACAGPDAPLDLERGLCASHMEHAYDFYKPCGFYPLVRHPSQRNLGLLQAVLQQVRACSCHKRFLAILSYVRCELVLANHQDETLSWLFIPNHRVRESAVR